jgi:hypothetical protein
MAFLPVARYAGTHLMISVTVNNAAGRIAIFVEQDPRAPAENHLEKTARDSSPTRPYAAAVEKARDRKFADSPLEGNGFEISVPRRIGSGFEASAGSGPINNRRGGITRAVVGLGKLIELFLRLKEPPVTRRNEGAHAVAGGEASRN